MNHNTNTQPASSSWLTKSSSRSHSHTNTNNNRRFAVASDWDSYEISTLSHRPTSSAPSVSVGVSVSHGRRDSNSIPNQYSNVQFGNRATAAAVETESFVSSSPELQSFRGLCHKNLKPTVNIPEEINGDQLNELQSQVVASVLSGYSVFFSGPAGSGKSFILRSILYLNEHGSSLVQPVMRRKKNIVLTATTGIAACAIGGTTVHSFAGVGTGEGRRDDMVSRVMSNDYTKKRWRQTDILVIDEVSMLPAQFLDTLDFIASRVRNDRRPFGGMQLVLCGDFYQLPPINLKSGFAFEAACWPKVIKCTVLLQQVFRQGGDPKLMDILNEARIGELSSSSVEILRAHSIQSNTPAGSNAKSSGVKPTLLECRNTEVDRANMLEMKKLPGETFAFKAKDRLANKAYTSILKNYQAPETLTLKVGAQVILLKNIDPEKGLVNGARGVVVDFKVQTKMDTDLLKSWKKMELPVVKFESMLPGTENEFIEILVEPEEWSNKVGDQIVCARYQVPLRLAWCLSIHKSQGMTIPHLTVNLSGVFEYGQAYVALSRATKLSLLTLRGFHDRNIRAHPKVKDFYNLIMSDNIPRSPIPMSSVSRNTLNVAGKMPQTISHQPTKLTYPQKRSTKICLAPLPQSNQQRGISPVFLNSKPSKSSKTCTPSPILNNSPIANVNLTFEQQQRAEKNRQRALEIRKRKMKEVSTSRNVSNGVHFR